MYMCIYIQIYINTLDIHIYYTILLFVLSPDKLPTHTNKHTQASIVRVSYETTTLIVGLYLNSMNTHIHTGAQTYIHIYTYTCINIIKLIGPAKMNCHSIFIVKIGQLLSCLDKIMVPL